MIRKPNALQKGIQRLVMWGPLNTFFAPRIHKLDKTVLKLTRGKFTLSEILGWNIIQLTTLGAKSLQPHSMPLVGMFAGEGIGLIASSFGRKHNPAWYYNLKAHPECQVEWRGRTRTYIARETEGDEYKKYWQLAVSYYAGYEKYRERAAHRRIPIMVLKPKE